MTDVDHHYGSLNTLCSGLEACMSSQSVSVAAPRTMAGCCSVERKERARMRESDGDILERGVSPCFVAMSVPRRDSDVSGCDDGGLPDIAPLSLPPSAVLEPDVCAEDSPVRSRRQVAAINAGPNFLRRLSVQPKERVASSSALPNSPGFPTDVDAPDASSHNHSNSCSDVTDGVMRDGLAIGDGVVADEAAVVTLRPQHSFWDGNERGTKSPSSVRRSKSFDRKLSEATIFAEAVGELPPSSGDEIQDIIDADGPYSSSDDEDDDDDQEPDENDVTATSHLGECGAVPQAAEDEVSAARPGILDFLPSPTDRTRTFDDKRQLTPATPETPKASTFLPFSDGPKTIVRSFWRPPSPNGVHAPSLLCDLPCASGIQEQQTGQEGGSEPPFAYRGIIANPPEITKRGLSRGNYAQLHRKAWLEVSDRHHRYGKNLRLYYKHWESLSHPTNMFFDWLDSEGEAAGQPLPDLPECPRSVLDSDTVHYIVEPEIQARYALSLVTADATPTCDERKEQERSGAVLLDCDGQLVRTGPEGWMFVLRDRVLYGAEKVTKVMIEDCPASGKSFSTSQKRFHHSSFFGGKAVAAAGILITDDNGRIKRLYPHSGHYRPGEAHMQRMLYFLQESGVNLNHIEVDVQQIMHVSRHIKVAAPKGGAVEDNPGGVKVDTFRKAKKVSSLYLRRGTEVACFLAHKARMIGDGVFKHVRCALDFDNEIGDAFSVCQFLEKVDGGGYWKKLRMETRSH